MGSWLGRSTGSLSIAALPSAARTSYAVYEQSRHIRSDLWLAFNVLFFFWKFAFLWWLGGIGGRIPPLTAVSSKTHRLAVLLQSSLSKSSRLKALIPRHHPE